MQRTTELVYAHNGQPVQIGAPLDYYLVTGEFYVDGRLVVTPLNYQSHYFAFRDDLATPILSLPVESSEGKFYVYDHEVFRVENFFNQLMVFADSGEMVPEGAVMQMAVEPINHLGDYVINRFVNGQLVITHEAFLNRHHSTPAAASEVASLQKQEKTPQNSEMVTRSISLIDLVYADTGLPLSRDAKRGVTRVTSPDGIKPNAPHIYKDKIVIQRRTFLKRQYCYADTKQKIPIDENSKIKYSETAQALLLNGRKVRRVGQVKSHLSVSHKNISSLSPPGRRVQKPAGVFTKMFNFFGGAENRSEPKTQQLHPAHTLIRLNENEQSDQGLSPSKR